MNGYRSEHARKRCGTPEALEPTGSLGFQCAGSRGSPRLPRWAHTSRASRRADQGGGGAAHGSLLCVTWTSSYFLNLAVRRLPDGRWFDPAENTWRDRRGRIARSAGLIWNTAVDDAPSCLPPRTWIMMQPTATTEPARENLAGLVEKVIHIRYREHLQYIPKCSTLILVVTSRCGNHPDLRSVQDGGADLDPGYRGAKSYTRKGTAKARYFRSAAKSTVKKLVILRAMPSCGGVPKRRVGSKGQTHTSSHRDSG